MRRLQIAEKNPVLDKETVCMRLGRDCGVIKLALHTWVNDRLEQLLLQVKCKTHPAYSYGLACVIMATTLGGTNLFLNRYILSITTSGISVGKAWIVAFVLSILFVLPTSKFLMHI